MLDIKAVKKVTVTEQVMEQIAHLITSGRLKPGEKLPNERELAERFQVARGRIREALRALSLIGLITIKAGEGSFVNQTQTPVPAETIHWMFHNEIHNLDEVYAARKLIESEVIMTAAANATPEQVERLEWLLNQMKEPAVRRSPAQFLNLLDMYDLYMGEICGNGIYAKLMQTIVHLRRETSLRLLGVPGSIDNSIETRSRILDAFKAKDTLRLKREIRSFFEKSSKFYNMIGKKTSKH
jgi:DNA-binding FadR family transcriptional regulator